MLKSSGLFFVFFWKQCGAESADDYILEKNVKSSWINEIKELKGKMQQRNITAKPHTHTHVEEEYGKTKHKNEIKQF